VSASPPPAALRALLRFAPDHELAAGRLALDGGIALFEYAPSFLASGLLLNPFFPEPRDGELVSARNPRYFEGLHGVFWHSLPDAWGMTLMRRRAEAHGIAFNSLSAIDLLRLVGSRGPGALVYQPEAPLRDDDAIDLDIVADDAMATAMGDEPTDIDQLERLGGSSGGARPKVLVGIGPDGALHPGDRDLPDGIEHWIVKFRSSRNDAEDIGPLEAAYADMARAAKLHVSPTRLLEGTRGRYFATKRFDRLPGNRRVHMLSAAALLDAPWEQPAIGYDDLLRTTRFVTRDQRAVDAMFRRMVFNVLAHNRDDHANQHAFLMTADGRWELAPAYDLTFSRGPGAEHYLDVGGRGGDDITRTQIEALGKIHGLSKKRADAIISEVSEAVSDFRSFAATYAVSPRTLVLVENAIGAGLRRISSPGFTPPGTL